MDSYVEHLGAEQKRESDKGGKKKSKKVWVWSLKAFLPLWKTKRGWTGGAGCSGRCPYREGETCQGAAGGDSGGTEEFLQREVFREESYMSRDPRTAADNA